MSSHATRRLKENFVHGAESDKIRHYIRENRQHSVIANLEARLVETEDRYWASISAINENFANIPESVVRQYPCFFRRNVGDDRPHVRRDRDPQQEDPSVQGQQFHAVPGRRHQHGWHAAKPPIPSPRTDRVWTLERNRLELQSRDRQEAVRGSDFPESVYAPNLRGLQRNATFAILCRMQLTLTPHAEELLRRAYPGIPNSHPPKLSNKL